MIKGLEINSNMKIRDIKQLIKQLDGKVRYVDEEGFVRKPRNDFGFLFLVIGIFFIYMLDNFQSELDILILFLLAYFNYLAIKYYSSHDIGTWKYSKHVSVANIFRLTN
jgi:Ca2+/Na+ antiporter